MDAHTAFNQTLAILSEILDSHSMPEYAKKLTAIQVKAYADAVRAELGDKPEPSPAPGGADTPA